MGLRSRGRDFFAKLQRQVWVNKPSPRHYRARESSLIIKPLASLEHSRNDTGLVLVRFRAWRYGLLVLLGYHIFIGYTYQ